MSPQAIKIKERDAQEIRFSGFGGQGVILAAYIAGKAAAIFEKRHSTLTRSFGPESRGGACSATVAIADQRVDYPFLRKMQVLVAMSQAAYLKYIDELAPGGTLVVESELVTLDKPRDDIKVYAAPTTRFAEEVGRAIVQNIVMLGFFTAVTRMIDPDAMRQALLSSVPPGTEELNTNAFNKGYEYGVEQLAEKG